MTVDTSPDPFDTTKASVARVYDYLLGGKDNFEVDRQFADRIVGRDPDAPITARLNKEFARRVTHHLAAEHGIAQYLDIGSGIPTSPPAIHEVARATETQARVVYVDHDPIVVRHNEALKAHGTGLAVIPGSFVDIDALMTNQQLVSTIDLNKPVAVSFYSVLQNTPLDEAVELLARLRQYLAPGSFLALSHVCDRTKQSVQDTVNDQIAEGTYPPTWFRSSAEVEALLAGFELLSPGMVDYRDWRPDDPLTGTRPELSTQLYGSVAWLPA